MVAVSLETNFFGQHQIAVFTYRVSSQDEIRPRLWWCHQRHRQGRHRLFHRTAPQNTWSPRHGNQNRSVHEYRRRNDVTS